VQCSVPGQHDGVAPQAHHEADYQDLDTALHCTALHCTALHCTALHCTALHFTDKIIMPLVCMYVTPEGYSRRRELNIGGNYTIPIYGNLSGCVMQICL
jgi:hypothetical protein